MSKVNGEYKGHTARKSLLYLKNSEKASQAVVCWAS